MYNNVNDFGFNSRTDIACPLRFKSTTNGLLIHQHCYILSWMCNSSHGSSRISYDVKQFISL